MAKRDIKRSIIRLLGAILLASMVFLCCGTPAVGQSSENLGSKPNSADKDAPSAFRTVQGSESEQIPGGLLMVTAYGVVWLLLLAYVVKIGRLQARTQRDLERLEGTFRVTRPPVHNEGNRG